MEVSNIFKKIQLTENSKIFVCCPSYYKTGGTELLHQLVYTLNANTKIHSFITYYSPTNDELKINPAFLKYVSEYKSFSNIEDIKQNVVIVPEIYTSLLSHIKNAKKIIWWESVDNYLLNTSPYFKFKITHSMLKTIKLILNILFKKNFKGLSLKQIRKISTLNLVQSEYAHAFLNKHSILNTYYLSDYINDIYFDKYIDIEKKENIVCYNPKKGYSFTKKLIKHSNNIKFIPLINMTNDQVVNTLEKSKVYIDFGNHPGKDRFPREAAMMKCIVITNQKGSAKYSEDVHIPEDFKIVDNLKNIEKIKKIIEKSFIEYPILLKDFNDYREKISKEKDQFVKDSINWFEII